MGFSFSIKITGDSGEEKPYEEYNEEKLEQIKSIITKMEDLRAELEGLISEEEDFRNDLPDDLVNSELSDHSEDVSDSLEEALSSLEESIDSLNNIL